ncbi:hypothetical protein ASG77_08040 [Arthrobacter sp. Soil762]|nr:hypothetical protein ASG77_08040 [Arthrobacter sp. Soil762]
MYGLGSGNVILNRHDGVIRALQHSILKALAEGRSVFLRSGGTSDSGEATHSVLWIPPTAQLAFIYETDVHPKLDDRLAGLFNEAIRESGGIELPDVRHEGDHDDSDLVATRTP